MQGLQFQNGASEVPPNGKLLSLTEGHAGLAVREGAP